MTLDRRRAIAAGAVVLVVAATLALVRGSQPAGLAAASPADQEVLSSPPRVVSLRFTEPVDARQSHIAVVSATGVSVAYGGPEVIGPTVRQPLDGRLDGAYRVGYHVVFLDGRQASGTVRFSVGSGAAEGPDQAAGEHSHTAVDPLSLALLCGDLALVFVLLAALLRRRQRTLRDVLRDPDVRR